jgi:hypothetical protein
VNFVKSNFDSIVGKVEPGKIVNVLFTIQEISDDSVVLWDVSNPKTVLVFC